MARAPVPVHRWKCMNSIYGFYFLFFFSFSFSFAICLQFLSQDSDQRSSHPAIMSLTLFCRCLQILAPEMLIFEGCRGALQGWVINVGGAAGHARNSRGGGPPKESWQ